LVLGEQSNTEVTVSAKVEETRRNGTKHPEVHRDNRRKWIQKRGKYKPSSPKPHRKRYSIMNDDRSEVHHGKGL